ncbi:recombination activating protein 1 [Amycolatopsis sp. NPDC050768]|uniref:recombination activating protein 1 n=1 Tax=Amycolatopsis sp. NPDC050768 TaxID=3154839 RepID=UPI00340B104D
MSQSSIPQQDNEIERLPCFNCGDSYESGDLARHTEPVHCGPCISCVDRPACFTCRLMYCVCEVHKYRG